MTTAGRTAAKQALIDSELEALRWHWGDAYEIAELPVGWKARRKDGRGGWFFRDTADHMYKAIHADYAAIPVPRSRAPGW